MAEVTYRPAHVKGEVRIPPSKSAAHRALLSAALCMLFHAIMRRALASQLKVERTYEHDSHAQGGVK